jgi:hypothetical protein
VSVCNRVKDVGILKASEFVRDANLPRQIAMLVRVALDLAIFVHVMKGSN